MIVRNAAWEDLAELIRMGQAFTEAAGQHEIDVESFAITVENLLDVGIVKVAADNVTQRVIGSISVMVFPSFWNHGRLLAQELWWWVDEDYRGSSAAIKLLKEAEIESKRMGAEKLLMLYLDGLEGAKMAQIYERLGYKPQERTFYKELSWE